MKTYKNDAVLCPHITRHYVITLEKQAPMWTLGVGGSPFDIGCCFMGSLLRVEVEELMLGDDRRADRSLLRGGALGDPGPSSKM